MKIKTLEKLAAGFALAGVLTLGSCASKPNYISRAIQRVDDYYKGEEAELFKKTYREVQQMDEKTRNSYLRIYEEYKEEILKDLDLTKAHKGLTETELKERFPWGFQNEEKIIIALTWEKFQDILRTQNSP